MRRMWVSGWVAGAGMLFVVGCAGKKVNPSLPAAGAGSSGKAAIQDVLSVRGQFVCERRLVGLAETLTARGEFVAQRGDSVRFTVNAPYRSDFIWHKGKVLGKTQHETEWTTANQPSHPGLTAVMGEMGRWMVDAQEGVQGMGMYRVAAGGEQDVAAMPAGMESGREQARAEMLLLTPSDANLEKSVKGVVLGLAGEPRRLVYGEITTQQGDMTRYWFSQVEVNGAVAAETFEPRRNSPTPPPSPSSPPPTAVKTAAPTREEIADAAARWPKEMRRPFFATIHALGNRITATGWCEEKSASDFRLTAVTEMGSILFDVRWDGKESHVARMMPGLPRSVVETICHDVSLALRAPEDLGEFKTHGHEMAAKGKSEGTHFTYMFGGTAGGAELAASEVDLGAFDTLEVRYTGYDTKGQMRDLMLHRAARGYTMWLTYTD